MNIQVYPHRIILNKTNEVNSGEYNVNECTFEFSQEYEGLTKVAVFSLCDGTTKNVTILNNQCIIPVECLQETGQVQIGVYGYATQDNELVLRYSPTPQNFVVRLGSYKEGTQPVAPTPTDWEILVEQVSDIAEDVSSIHEDITGINGEISGINIDIRDLQDTKANISDLAEVAFTGEFSDLKNIPSYATTQQLNQEIQDRQDADVNLQSQIDAISVSSDVVDVVGTYQELLDYDTTHLKDNDIVKVLQDSTHSDALSYYRWDKETSTWSYVGSEGPFYTKAETRDLLNAKEDKITTTNKLDADLVDDSNSTNKFVTEEDITYWDNKEDKSNKVTEINSSSTDTQYPSAKCVYDSQEEQNEHIAELEMLYNAFPTVSDEDTTIQLDNTAKVKFREIDLKGNTSQVVIPEEQGTSVSNTSIYVSDVDTDKENTIEISGNTYQETTTGKNLLYLASQYDYGQNGVNGAYNETDGSFTIIGTATASTNSQITRTIPLELTAGTYTFSLDHSISKQIYLHFNFDGGATQNLVIPAGQTEVTDTLTADTTGYNIRFSTTNGNTYNETVKMQLESGSTATSFEKFTYGASPNPDYPQNIEVVTGTNNVEVCGKNLCNLENLGLIVNTTGKVQTNPTYWNCVIDTTNNNSLYVSGDYTLLGDNVIRVGGFNEYPALNSQGTRITSGTNTAINTTNYNYVMFCFGVKEGHTIDEVINSFMITYGNEYVTYEAYQGTTYPVNLGNIELCRLNVDNTIYKDRIYPLNNKWYLEKNIIKIIINGSEGYWFRASTNTNTLRFNNENAIPNGYVINAIKIMSNKFINGSSPNDNGDYEHIRNGVSDYPNSLSIIIDKTRLSGNTATDFTTWLSNNNVTVYYLANTPTTTEITDTTLVNQLNALYNATIYPITNINTETSNLLPYIDLHYNFVTPSPSPSRPSVVNVVKGNNTITISNSDNTESQSYPINLGDMELCKIGTYQDYIYKSGGNWFKKSNIGKVVLNGSENWSKRTDMMHLTNTSCFRGSYSSEVNGNALQNTPQISNRFVCLNDVTDVEHIRYTGVTNYRFQVFINKSRLSSDDETGFKTWLSTHNTIVYYVLETPTDTQITDTTLINQLNNIKKAYSYDTQTNISQTNEDKPFIIYAEAIRSLKDVFE